jgi:hypothetical protein
MRGRRGRDRMVIGFTTTYAIGALYSVKMCNLANFPDDILTNQNIY